MHLQYLHTNPRQCRGTPRDLLRCSFRSYLGNRLRWALLGCHHSRPRLYRFVDRNLQGMHRMDLQPRHYPYQDNLELLE